MWLLKSSAIMLEIEVGRKMEIQILESSRIVVAGGKAR